MTAPRDQISATALNGDHGAADRLAEAELEAEGSGQARRRLDNSTSTEAEPL